MNRDELSGKKNQVRGRVKQAWGDLTADDKLRNEGVADEAAGKVEEGIGKTRRKVGKTLRDVARKIDEG